MLTRTKKCAIIYKHLSVKLIPAGVAEQADATDLKSVDTKVSYRFDPGHRHQSSVEDGKEPAKINIAEWSSW